ncbi:GNAT family N-acetyltransferase [Streptomyces sp. NRRL B-2790]|uniref:GNAT family N-acetyltransferase n=1 Tax=Streptomyces sp. NRRL B-2790 TaxID=1463835 RepID=UPI003568AFFD
MTATESARLVIAHVNADEALHRDFVADPPDAHIVRVRNPDPTLREEFERAGFLLTPGWVNWIAPVRSSEEEYLAGLVPGERKEIRRVRRMLERDGVTLHVTHGIDEGDLERFLTLYDRQVERMPQGVNFLRRQLRQIRAEHDRIIAGFALADGVMVAGCLGWIRRDGALLHLRFSATDTSGRLNGAVRGVYLKMFQAARERGCDWISLGNDPALYGHTVQPGLFVFKSRLGFTPVASRAVDVTIPSDEADLILDLGPLARPSVMLAHHDAPVSGPVSLDEAPRLRAVVLSDGLEYELQGLRTDAVAVIERRRVPARLRDDRGE